MSTSSGMSKEEFDARVKDLERRLDLLAAANERQRIQLESLVDSLVKHSLEVITFQ